MWLVWGQYGVLWNSWVFTVAQVLLQVVYG